MPASRLLAVLSSDPEGPVVRHRWRAYEGALAEAGIVLEVVSWPKDGAGRRFAMQRASTADAAVLSSRLLRKRDVRQLRGRARRLAFDFDDALPYRDSARDATPSKTRGKRFRAIVQAADRVTAGNDYLAGLVSACGATAQVFPTTVRVPAGPPKPESAEKPLLVGWIGARATLPYLEQQAVVLSALVASGHVFRLRVIADALPTLPPGINVELIPWELDTWRAHLEAIHLGMAPLPDDAWTRGKCGLKVLQMLAAGRPVVAAGVGVQRDQVRSGETGFVANDQETFLLAMQTLMESPEQRRAMGVAAREDVRARWSVEAWAPRLVAEVEALLA